jgi:ribokinase
VKEGPIVAVGAHMQSLFMHVDRIPLAGETVLGSDYQEPNDGGKVANAAVAAARLGAPVALVTLVGTDDWADRSRQYLDNEGIDTTWMMTEEGKTDVGVVLLPPTGIPAIASIAVLSRWLTSERINRASEIFESASIVVCALESPVDGVREAFVLGRKSGALTILNPSPPEAMEEDLLALTDILVMNEHEAVVLAGRKGSADKLAKRIADRMDASTVIVTAGSAGAVLAVRGVEPRAFPAPRTSVVDTTGAGDAFTGALAASLHDGSSLDTAIGSAIHVASHSVARKGTMDAYPRRQEIAIGHEST